VTQILNKFAHKLYQGKYNSDFAVQITSNVADAQQMTINFANNNLNGHTFLKKAISPAKQGYVLPLG